MANADAAAGERAAGLLRGAMDDPSSLLAPLPAECTPADAAQAYAVQAVLMEGLGAIGGWKVGAASNEALPVTAPMPAAWLHHGPAVLPVAQYPRPLAEGETCYRIGRDLPPAGAPYSREQIIDAIAAIHVGAEIVQPRFPDPASLDPLVALADLLGHAGYVVGDEVVEWQGIDLAAQSLALNLDGAEAKSRAGYPFPEPIRIIQWLANEGSHWAGGLKADQFVTTGSWIGAVPMRIDQAAEVVVTGVGKVAFIFG